MLIPGRNTDEDIVGVNVPVETSEEMKNLNMYNKMDGISVDRIRPPHCLLSQYFQETWLLPIHSSIAISSSSGGVRNPM